MSIPVNYHGRTEEDGDENLGCFSVYRRLYCMLKRVTVLFGCVEMGEFFMSTIWVRGASPIFVAPCFLLKKTNTNFNGFGCCTCSFLKRNKNENSDITMYHFWKMLFAQVKKSCPRLA